MDTSEIYIKMSDHPKIQGALANYRDPIPLYFFVLRDGGGGYQTHMIFHCSECEPCKNTVYFPRQDQIQTMTGVTSVFSMAYNLYYHAEEIRNPYDRYPAESMEQLWLMYYMFKKHKLKWNGEEWK